MGTVILMSFLLIKVELSGDGCVYQRGRRKGKGRGVGEALGSEVKNIRGKGQVC